MYTGLNTVQETEATKHHINRSKLKPWSALGVFHRHQRNVAYTAAFSKEVYESQYSCMIISTVHTCEISKREKLYAAFSMAVIRVLHCI